MASAKAPRTDFALPDKKMFPLNTKGRRQVASLDAAAAERAGSITPSEEMTVKRKAKMARGNNPVKPRTMADSLKMMD